MRVTALVLTGGLSSRMGRPKALLYAGKETFLQRILRTLESGGLDDIIVVTGAHDREIRRACLDMELAAGIRVVTNPDFARGQLSSIRAGLEAADAHHPDAIVLALVDHPLVRPATIVALLEAFHATRAPVVRPACEGRHGHPVLFSSELFDALRQAPLEGGARTVVRALGNRVLTVPVDDPGIAQDIDTPEDYQAALGGLNRADSGTD